MAEQGFKIASRGASKGRSLQATKVYEPGDLIATFSKPLLALPDAVNTRLACNHCLRNAPKLRACTGCQCVVYCSTVCQKSNWALVHRHECKSFQAIRKSTGKDWLPVGARATMQILLRLQHGDVSVQQAFGSLNSDRSGKNGELEGNVDKFREDEKNFADLQLQAMGAVQYAGLQTTSENLDKATQILCKIQTNAFDRYDPDTGQAGIFLESTLAMMNHSCLPNAFVAFHERKAILKAETPIHVGDDIEISYIDYLLPKSLRWKALRQYHFQCGCQRCSDDLDVYQVCRFSPNISLNRFSLVPELDKSNRPPYGEAQYNQLAKQAIESLYIRWTEAGKLGGNELDRTKARWQICHDLVEAKMWAIEPVPATILELLLIYQAQQNFAYALVLASFLAIHCHPYQSAAPFNVRRVKGVMMVANLLTHTASLAGTGELAKTCPNDRLCSLLNACDQVTMCEALAHLVLHWGFVGHSKEWDVFHGAQETLVDIQSLPGRAKESRLLQNWAQSKGADLDGAMFFRKVVLDPLGELAAFAPEVLRGELQPSLGLTRIG